MNRAFIAVAVMSVITASIRFLPFIIFKGKQTPRLLEKLSKGLPYAVMGMLVVYCLKGLSFRSISEYLPTAVALLTVTFSYIIKKNSLISIILGTAVYMALVR